MAVNEQGMLSVSRISDMIVEKFFQNPVTFEHYQMVWATWVRTEAQVLCASSVPGKHLANLALL